MIKPIWQNDKYGVEVFESRNLKILKQFPDNYFDSCITDPPYGIAFMGRKWDYQIPKQRIWEEVLRVLKPGAHLLSFGGSRTFHRIACSVEDAGFELRDCIMWLYGSGFPKSADVSKLVDKKLGGKRKVIGVKPGHEGFVGRKDHPLNSGWDRPWASDPEAVARYHSLTEAGTEEAKQWQGWGSALKPAFEPICLARKPLDGTIAENTLKHGVGGMNIDGCRINPGEPVPGGGGLKGGAGSRHEGWRRPSHEDGTSTEPHNLGRWPANVMHDGSEEVLEEFAKYGETISIGKTSRDGRKMKFGMGQQNNVTCPIDSGTVARFFYTAKASTSDRGQENDHPTVKPKTLMDWLCTLITPKGGRILDPFSGSFTTGVAAVMRGFKFTGIDMDAKYCQIGIKRLKKAIQKYAGTFGF